jgi:hypothetical protein
MFVSPLDNVAIKLHVRIFAVILAPVNISTAAYGPASAAEAMDKVTVKSSRRVFVLSDTTDTGAEGFNDLIIVFNELAPLRATPEGTTTISSYVPG